MRGFAYNTNPNETGTVLVLLDGRRFGNNDAGFIPLQNVERIEIIRGAASVQYGTEATGDVVNIISRRGKEVPTLFVEYDLASFDRSDQKVGFSGILAKGKIDYSFGYSHLSSKAVNVGGGRLYPNTGIKYRHNFGVNIGYNFNEDHRLGLVINGSLGQYGRAGTFAALTPYGRGYRNNYSGDIQYSGSLPDSNLSWQIRYFQGKNIFETSSN
jgi:vitamin B12 transporter